MITGYIGNNIGYYEYYICSRGHLVEKVNTNKKIQITIPQLRSGPYWSILERINTRDQ